MKPSASSTFLRSPNMKSTAPSSLFIHCTRSMLKFLRALGLYFPFIDHLFNAWNLRRSKGHEISDASQIRYRRLRLWF